MTAAMSPCGLTPRVCSSSSSPSVLDGASKRWSTSRSCRFLPLSLRVEKFASISGLRLLSTSGKHLGASHLPDLALARRGPLTVCDARGNFEKVVEIGFKTGKDAVDSAAEFVPSTVPKPIAKGGIVLVGGLIIWSVLSSILSTFFSLVVVGGAAYVAFQYWSKGSGGSSGSSGSSSTKGEDPLDEARRIMDKYK